MTADRPAMTMREIRERLGHIRPPVLPGPNPQELADIEAAVAASFDATEPPEVRTARWEAAAWAAGRTVDRNALAVYLAVADAEMRALADDWAKRAEASDAEVRSLTARVTELEGPAVYARAALAALCYDLEDPGTEALGALCELSRVTTGVEAPKDDTALALAQHDAEVIRGAARVLEETDRDDDAVNLLYLLADRTGRAEETHVVADDNSDHA